MNKISILEAFAADAINSPAMITGGWQVQSQVKEQKKEREVWQVHQVRQVRQERQERQEQIRGHHLCARLSEMVSNYLRIFPSLGQNRRGEA